MIRVLLVDDHKLVRIGIRQVLESATNIEVVGEAENGEDGIRLARELQPDVVLLDINMPGIGGVECLRRIKAAADSHVIVVSVHRDPPLPARMLESGASGYLSKDRAADEVVRAVKTVTQNRRYLTEDIARDMALHQLDPEHHGLGALSEREIQVMLLVAEGLAIPAIAEALAVSPKTVNTYRYRLFEKLDVHNDVELTRYAIRHGLIKDMVGE